MRLRAIALRLCGALLLAACGSSSSGGGQNTPEVAITVADADVVAAEVMRGIVISTDFAEVSSGPGSSVETTAVAVAAGGVTAAFEVPPTTRDCAEGGSVTVQGDVAVVGTLTGDDVLEADFSACQQEEDGFILDGSLDFLVRAFTGDLDDAFRLEVQARFTDLEMSLEGDPPTEADGLVELVQDTRSPQLQLVAMSEGPITFSEGDHTLTLTLFQNSADRNITTGDYELNGAGSVISSVFDGARAAYAIVDTLAGDVPGEPAEGELRINGADDATLLLIAQGTNVELEVDLDGDGPLEPQSQTLSWDALYAATPAPPPPP